LVVYYNALALVLSKVIAGESRQVYFFVCKVFLDGKSVDLRFKSGLSDQGMNDSEAVIGKELGVVLDVLLEGFVIRLDQGHWREALDWSGE
jgi:hypothetical protein